MEADKRTTTMAHRGRQLADDPLIQALACGATVENAARQAGVSPRTAHRRMADKKFRRRLHLARADMAQRTAGALTAATLEAVRTLMELLKPPNPPAVRLGASRTILEMSLKLREATDWEERLAALEERLDGVAAS
jgi:hypothetical protein